MTAFVHLPCEDRVRTQQPCAKRTVAVGAWVLLATTLGSSMPSIDGTAVGVALPVLQRDLSATSSAMQWVIEGYSLFLSALILVGGSLGDRFGRRKMFVLGVLLFALASVACAISANVSQLVIARCVQGIGGALLIPESLALITAAFDERSRGKAIGTWSGFGAIATAIGPLLGGWFVQSLSWRFVFLINVPIAVLIVIVTQKYIDESRDLSDNARVDWLGAGVVTAALGLLTYGFIALQGAKGDLLGFATIAGGFALLAFFVYVERRCAAPMVPLGLFASGPFAISNLYTLLLYAGFGAAFFFIPFNLINVQGYTPTQAGAALLPMILIMFLLSRWSGGLVAWAGARIPLTVGAIITAFGFVLFAFTGVGRTYLASFFPAVLVLGIGAAVFVAPLTTTVMNSISAEHSGTASGINNAVSRIAGLLAIAALGIVLVSSTHAALNANPAVASLSSTTQRALASDTLLSGRLADRSVTPSDRIPAQRLVDEAYAIGFRDLMLICAALALVSAFLAFACLKASN